MKQCVVGAFLVLVVLAGWDWWSVSGTTRTPEVPEWVLRLDRVTLSSEMHEILRPLMAYHLSGTDAETVARFYLDFASVVRGDRLKVLKSTSQFRDAHRAACELMFSESGITRSNPGIVESVDVILGNGCGCKRTPEGGWEVQELSENLRERLAMILDGIAWTFYSTSNHD